MIHAYLFTTDFNNAHQNGGHGPNFLELMHEINKISGLKLSVYHHFHDEVAKY